MTTSVLLARLIGPIFVIIAIGVLLNRDHYRNMIGDFLNSSALYYMSGVLAFVVGVAIVQFHNLWVFDWRVIITILGWMSILKGVVRITQPALGAKFAGRVTDSKFLIPVITVVLIVLGGWLSFEGFRPV